MSEKQRLRIVNHKGKDIFIIDHSNLSLADVENNLIDMKEFAKQFTSPVLFLADFTGVKLDRKILTLLIKHAKPYKSLVKKGAVIGFEKYRGLFRAANLFSSIPASNFSSIEEAKDWLIEK